MAAHFYNGVLYNVELAWSNPFYGQKSLWKIYTDEENFCTARKAILGWLNTDNCPSKGEYDQRNLGRDFMSYLKGFYTFRFNEEENCFEYYREKGYDD